MFGNIVVLLLTFKNAWTVKKDVINSDIFQLYSFYIFGSTLQFLPQTLFETISITI